DNMAYVNLFTRPRRFGKTLNLSMLKYYFENTGDAVKNKRNAALFPNLPSQTLVKNILRK
ncbi:MAG: AAA family ATPase, partial [Lachnospiraceae bacterium]|nr:AAA family ATPase [Lachnospiraceae bacterium]